MTDGPPNPTGANGAVPDDAGKEPALDEQEPGRDTSPSRRDTRRRIRTIAALLAVLAVPLALYGVSRFSGRAPTLSSGGAPAKTLYGGQAGQALRPLAASAIAARVDPGLVDINVYFMGGGGRGAATGMVLTPTGEVLTNNHVVQGATRITARDVGNGRTYSATVVGYDRAHDVAVLQLRGASGLQTVPLGASTPSVGARVTALGNAGGVGGTPTVAQGRIVGLDRTIVASDMGGGNAEQLRGLIVTNAPIRPGDSGGPLVNDFGQVIGMDAAASGGQAAQGGSRARGFAIPMDEALSITRQIEAGAGSSTVHVGGTGFLGVQIVPAAQLGPGFGVGRGGRPRGAVVGGVLPGYPAQQAGLAQGDVITSVDGHVVTSPSVLSGLLSVHHPGDAVRLGWVDPSGQTHAATVRLASGPAA
jgi:S1-C subfamily serine protease